MTKGKLYLFGYVFQPDSRIDGAFLGGVYSAGAGLCLEVIARGVVDLKKTIDTKFREIPEEQAKESAKAVKRKLKFIIPAAAAAGIVLGSMYPQKANEIGINIERKVHKAAYSAGRYLNKAFHSENKK